MRDTSGNRCDGLNVLAQDRDILKQAQSQVILTPHPGEMARLWGQHGRIMANRVEKAQEAAAAFQAIVVLKGPRPSPRHHKGLFI